MPAGRFLLIDNSNSFTKFCLADADCILGQTRRLPTRAVSGAAVTRLLRGWRYQSVVLSSVVPAKAGVLRKALAPAPVLQVSAKMDLGVKIDYPEPKSIGADRLANAVYAAAQTQGAAIVVDFGTAVSFDIIARPRRYVGGVIAPGLEAMTDYLHQRTALLPKITLLEPPSAIGKSTRHAMLAGAVYGYRGLIREILRQIRSELGEKRVRVLATGGYAELIAAGLPEISEIHPELTLEGLRIIGTLNGL